MHVSILRILMVTGCIKLYVVNNKIADLQNELHFNLSRLPQTLPSEKENVVKKIKIRVNPIKSPLLVSITEQVQQTYLVECDHFPEVFPRSMPADHQCLVCYLPIVL